DPVAHEPVATVAGLAHDPWIRIQSRPGGVFGCHEAGPYPVAWPAWRPVAEAHAGRNIRFDQALDGPGSIARGHFRQATAIAGIARHPAPEDHHDPAGAGDAHRRHDVEAGDPVVGPVIDENGAILIELPFDPQDPANQPVRVTRLALEHYRLGGHGRIAHRLHRRLLV